MVFSWNFSAGRKDYFCCFFDIYFFIVFMSPWTVCYVMGVWYENGYFLNILKSLQSRLNFEIILNLDLISHHILGLAFIKQKTFLYSKSWHTKSSWFVLLFAIIDVILKCQVSCWKTGFTLVLHVELVLYLGKKNRGIEFFWLFNIFFRIRLYKNPNTQSIAPLIRR